MKTILEIGLKQNNCCYQPAYQGKKYVLPFRKKKKSELSDEEKKYNRKHSKLRVIVEHTVSRIKKFGIMGTKFRNKLGRYDHACDIVSELVNFRIMLTNRTIL